MGKKKQPQTENAFFLLLRKKNMKRFNVILYHVFVHGFKVSFFKIYILHSLNEVLKVWVGIQIYKTQI